MRKLKTEKSLSVFNVIYNKGVNYTEKIST
jgi:hypothetical protein